MILYLCNYKPKRIIDIRNYDVYEKKSLKAGRRHCYGITWKNMVV